MFVTTLLCSTKLTQNIDLLSLLQWKAHPEKISEALGRVLRLDGEELVKFLQDILDALFAMFHTEDGNSTAHSGLVFQVQKFPYSPFFQVQLRIYYYYCKNTLLSGSRLDIHPPGRLQV